MSEIVHAAVDDLTADSGHRCAGCGTVYELTRPNALVYEGMILGEIICTDCERRSIEREHDRAMRR